MIGTYMPTQQRIKLAQQGRKSHFALGKSENAFSTTQTSFYRSFQAKPAPRSDPKNRTASHFTMGSDNKNKASEFTVKYHSHSPGPKKPQAKIINLTPSNVVMGMQKMSFTPESTSYKPVKGPASFSYSTSPERNKKHSITLGNDPLTKSSVMQANFSPVKPAQTEKLDQNLLDSHIVMGSHPKLYKSVAVNNFEKKNGSPGSLGKEKVNDLKKEHFVLGKDNAVFANNQQISYKPLTSQKQGLPQDRLDYLKNSHFAFTAEQPGYISVSKCSMRYSAADPRTQENYLKVNHVAFGDDKPRPMTQYCKTHYYRPQSVSVPVRTKNDEMNSDVVLGVTNAPLNVSAAVFTGEKGTPGRLDPQLEKNLRGHHYTLGNSSNIYERSHKNYGTGKPDPSRFQNELQQDMTSTHWVSGFHRENLSTTTRTCYREKTGEKRDVEGYLKRHNHALGDGANNWNSTYNGKFQWIDPVPDNSAKFSFDN